MSNISSNNDPSLIKGTNLSEGPFYLYIKTEQPTSACIATQRGQCTAAYI